MKLQTAHRLLLTTLVLVAALITKAQVAINEDPELLKRIAKYNTVHEIMNEVQQHYAQKSPDGHFEKQRGFKLWMRWAHEALRTAGPGNTLSSPVKTLLELYEKDNNQPQIEQQNTSPIWSFVGPLTSTYADKVISGSNGIGRCDRIAFHPTDPNIIYVGTPMGGLWRTTNRGTTWTCLTSFLPVPGVSGIAIDPNSPSHIIIATGNADNVKFTQTQPSVFTSAGLFRSKDNGANWQVLPIPWPTNLGVVVFRIAQSPVSPNKLIIATSMGVYRSLDTGRTWANLTSGRAFDADFVPGTDSCYVAVTYPSGESRILCTPDGGLSLGTQIPFAAGAQFGFNRLEIAVNPARTGSFHTIYAFAGPVTAAGQFRGLFRNNASNQMALVRNTPNLFGSTTTGLDDFDQSGYDQCIAVHPKNPSILLTGGAIVFRSTDGGATMPFSSYYTEPGPDLSKYIHADIHDLAYNILDNSLYAATDGGFFRSADNGVSYDNLTIGITTSQFYHLSGYEPDQFHLMGGLQDNGVKYRNSNTSDLIHIAGADGFCSGIWPNDPSKGYLSSNQFFWRLNNLPSKSETGINPTTTPQWFWRMQTDPVNGAYVYASDQNHDSIWISNNGGDSWMWRRAANGNRSIGTCPTNLNRVYALGSFPIFNTATTTLKRSDDKGNTWSSNLILSPGLPPLSEAVPNSLSVMPTNSNVLAMAYSGVSSGNKVFLSADAGANWVNISFNLPNIPINTIQIDNGLNIYIGTDYGVYHRRNGASTWLHYSNRLPRTIVNQLVLNQTSGTLYAATFGRGIFRTTTYNTCVEWRSLGGNLQGVNVFEASNAITSNALIDGGAQTSVFFKTNDSIKLTEGFLAMEGITSFLAALGPCGAGLPVLTAASQAADGHHLLLPTYPAALASGYTKAHLSNKTDKSIMLSQSVPGVVQVRFRKNHDGSILILYESTSKQTDGVPTEIQLSQSIPNESGNLELWLNGELVHMQEWQPGI